SGSKQKLVALTDRDRRLFFELSIMRFIDRDLAKTVAGFNSTTRVNARLLLLTQAGYLTRTFIGSISGGRKAVYRLSSKAIPTDGALLNSPGSRSAINSHSELFIEHQLAVNDIYALVKHKPIPLAGVQFHRWMSFNQPLSKACLLVPDGYF